MEKPSEEKEMMELLNFVIEECYLVARGTHHFKNRGFTRSQMYWKGRAEAANEVRALKNKLSWPPKVTKK